MRTSSFTEDEVAFALKQAALSIAENRCWPARPCRYHLGSGSRLRQTQDRQAVGWRPRQAVMPSRAELPGLRRLPLCTAPPPPATPPGPTPGCPGQSPRPCR